MFVVDWFTVVIGFVFDFCTGLFYACICVVWFRFVVVARLVWWFEYLFLDFVFVVFVFGCGCGFWFACGWFGLFVFSGVFIRAYCLCCFRFALYIGCWVDCCLWFIIVVSWFGCLWLF